ncbi:unnamed protein product [Amoebophrya sp. A120]|nr:unnamed protein product [Amoebophrya sp. A120]|eukprot:GSA120T00006778001.1
MNEADLTGEPMPVSKLPLEFGSAECLDLAKHGKKHFLYCGTEILSSVNSAAFEEHQSDQQVDKPCKNADHSHSAVGAATTPTQGAEGSSCNKPVTSSEMFTSPSMEPSGGNAASSNKDDKDKLGGGNPNRGGFLSLPTPRRPGSKNVVDHGKIKRKARHVQMSTCEEGRASDKENVKTMEKRSSLSGGLAATGLLHSQAPGQQAQMSNEATHAKLEDNVLATTSQTTTPPAEEVKKPPPVTRAIGLVIHTGSYTLNGSLVRKILFPLPVRYVFQEQFVWILFTVASVLMLISMIPDLLVNQGQVYQNIITSLMDALRLPYLMCNPGILAGLAMAQKFASLRLWNGASQGPRVGAAGTRSKTIEPGSRTSSPAGVLSSCNTEDLIYHKTRTLELKRLLLAGEVDVQCLDKTGTITEPSLQQKLHGNGVEVEMLKFALTRVADLVLRGKDERAQQYRNHLDDDRNELRDLAARPFLSGTDTTSAFANRTSATTSTSIELNFRSVTKQYKRVEDNKFLFEDVVSFPKENYCRVPRPRKSSSSSSFSSFAGDGSKGAREKRTRTTRGLRVPQPLDVAHSRRLITDPQFEFREGDTESDSDALARESPRTLPRFKRRSYRRMKVLLPNRNRRGGRVVEDHDRNRREEEFYDHYRHRHHSSPAPSVSDADRNSVGTSEDDEDHHHDRHSGYYNNNRSFCSSAGDRHTSPSRDYAASRASSLIGPRPTAVSNFTSEEYRDEEKNKLSRHNSFFAVGAVSSSISRSATFPAVVHQGTTLMSEAAAMSSSSSCAASPQSCITFGNPNNSSSCSEAEQFVYDNVRTTRTNGGPAATTTSYDAGRENYGLSAGVQELQHAQLAANTTNDKATSNIRGEQGCGPPDTATDKSSKSEEVGQEASNVEEHPSEVLSKPVDRFFPTDPHYGPVPSKKFCNLSIDTTRRARSSALAGAGLGRRRTATEDGSGGGTSYKNNYTKYFFGRKSSGDHFYNNCDRQEININAVSRTAGPRTWQTKSDVDPRPTKGTGTQQQPVDRFFPTDPHYGPVPSKKFRNLSIDTTRRARSSALAGAGFGRRRFATEDGCSGGSCKNNYTKYFFGRKSSGDDFYNNSCTQEININAVSGSGTAGPRTWQRTTSADVDPTPTEGTGTQQRWSQQSNPVLLDWQLESFATSPVLRGERNTTRTTGNNIENQQGSSSCRNFIAGGELADEEMNASLRRVSTSSGQLLPKMTGTVRVDSMPGLLQLPVPPPAGRLHNSGKNAPGGAPSDWTPWSRASNRTPSLEDRDSFRIQHLPAAPVDSYPHPSSVDSHPQPFTFSPRMSKHRLESYSFDDVHHLPRKVPVEAPAGTRTTSLPGGRKEIETDSKRRQETAETDLEKQQGPRRAPSSEIDLEPSTTTGPRPGHSRPAQESTSTGEKHNALGEAATREVPAGDDHVHDLDQDNASKKNEAHLEAFAMHNEHQIQTPPGDETSPTIPRIEQETELLPLIGEENVVGSILSKEPNEEGVVDQAVDDVVAAYNTLDTPSAVSARREDKNFSTNLPPKPRPKLRLKSYSSDGGPAGEVDAEETVGNKLPGGTSTKNSLDNQEQGENQRPAKLLPPRPLTLSLFGGNIKPSAMPDKMRMTKGHVDTPRHGNTNIPRRGTTRTGPLTSPPLANLHEDDEGDADAGRSHSPESAPAGGVATLANGRQLSSSSKKNSPAVGCSSWKNKSRSRHCRSWKRMREDNTFARRPWRDPNDIVIREPETTVCSQNVVEYFFSTGQDQSDLVRNKAAPPQNKCRSSTSAGRRHGARTTRSTASSRSTSSRKGKLPQAKTAAKNKSSGSTTAQKNGRTSQFGDETSIGAEEAANKTSAVTRFRTIRQFEFDQKLQLQSVIVEVVVEAPPAGASSCSSSDLLKNETVGKMNKLHKNSSVSSKYYLFSKGSFEAIHKKCDEQARAAALKRASGGNKMNCEGDDQEVEDVERVGVLSTRHEVEKTGEELQHHSKTSSTSTTTSLTTSTSPEQEKGYQEVQGSILSSATPHGMIFPADAFQKTKHLALEGFYVLAVGCRELTTELLPVPARRHLAGVLEACGDLEKDLPEQDDEDLREQVHKLYRDQEKTLLEDYLFKASRAELEAKLNQFLGLIYFRNELKPDSSAAIQILKQGNIRPVILTGDNLFTAVHVAQRVGLCGGGRGKSLMACSSSSRGSGGQQTRTSASAGSSKMSDVSTSFGTTTRRSGEKDDKNEQKQLQDIVKNEMLVPSTLMSVQNSAVLSRGGLHQPTTRTLRGNMLTMKTSYGNGSRSRDLRCGDQDEHFISRNKTTFQFDLGTDEELQESSEGPDTEIDEQRVCLLEKRAGARGGRRDLQLLSRKNQAAQLPARPAFLLGNKTNAEEESQEGNSCTGEQDDVAVVVPPSIPSGTSPRQLHLEVVPEADSEDDVVERAEMVQHAGDNCVNHVVEKVVFLAGDVVSSSKEKNIGDGRVALPTLCWEYVDDELCQQQDADVEHDLQHPVLAVWKQLLAPVGKMGITITCTDHSDRATSSDGNGSDVGKMNDDDVPVEQKPNQADKNACPPVLDFFPENYQAILSHYKEDYTTEGSGRATASMVDVESCFLGSDINGEQELLVHQKKEQATSTSSSIHNSGGAPPPATEIKSTTARTKNHFISPISAKQRADLFGKFEFSSDFATGNAEKQVDKTHKLVFKTEDEILLDAVAEVSRKNAALKRQKEKKIAELTEMKTHAGFYRRSRKSTRVTALSRRPSTSACKLDAVHLAEGNKSAADKPPCGQDEDLLRNGNYIKETPESGSSKKNHSTASNSLRVPAPTTFNLQQEEQNKQDVNSCCTQSQLHSARARGTTPRVSFSGSHVASTSNGPASTLSTGRGTEAEPWSHISFQLHVSDGVNLSDCASGLTTLQGDINDYSVGYHLPHGHPGPGTSTQLLSGAPEPFLQLKSNAHLLLPSPKNSTCSGWKINSSRTLQRTNSAALTEDATGVATTFCEAGTKTAPEVQLQLPKTTSSVTTFSRDGRVIPSPEREKDEETLCLLGGNVVSCTEEEEKKGNEEDATAGAVEVVEQDTAAAATPLGEHVDELQPLLPSQVYQLLSDEQKETLQQFPHERHEAQLEMLRKRLRLQKAERKRQRLMAQTGATVEDLEEQGSTPDLTPPQGQAQAQEERKEQLACDTTGGALHPAPKTAADHLQQDAVDVLARPKAAAKSRPEKLYSEKRLEEPEDHHFEQTQTKSKPQSRNKKVIYNRYKFVFCLTESAYRLLQERDPELLEKILPRIQVFARMTPSGKVAVIQHFQAKKHTVGMVGDGGNDCASLRASHAGLALANGEKSLVASFSTQSESLFSLIELIREGRTCLTISTSLFEFSILVGVAAVCFNLLKVIELSTWHFLSQLCFEVLIPSVGCLTILLSSQPAGNFIRITGDEEDRTKNGGNSSAGVLAGRHEEQRDDPSHDQKSLAVDEHHCYTYPGLNPVRPAANFFAKPRLLRITLFSLGIILAMLVVVLNLEQFRPGTGADLVLKYLYSLELENSEPTFRSGMVGSGVIACFYGFFVLAVSILLRFSDFGKQRNVNFFRGFWPEFVSFWKSGIAGFRRVIFAIMSRMNNNKTKSQKMNPKKDSTCTSSALALLWSPPRSTSNQNTRSKEEPVAAENFYELQESTALSTRGLVEPGNGPRRPPRSPQLRESCSLFLAIAFSCLPFTVFFTTNTVLNACFMINTDNYHSWMLGSGVKTDPMYDSLLTSVITALKLQTRPPEVYSEQFWFSEIDNKHYELLVRDFFSLDQQEPEDEDDDADNFSDEDEGGAVASTWSLSTTSTSFFSKAKRLLTGTGSFWGGAGLSTTAGIFSNGNIKSQRRPSALMRMASFKETEQQKRAKRARMRQIKKLRKRSYEEMLETIRNADPEQNPLTWRLKPGREMGRVDVQVADLFDHNIQKPIMLQEERQRVGPEPASRSTSSSPFGVFNMQGSDIIDEAHHVEQPPTVNSGRTHNHSIGRRETSSNVLPQNETDSELEEDGGLHDANVQLEASQQTLLQEVRQSLSSRQHYFSETSGQEPALISYNDLRNEGEGTRGTSPTSDINRSRDPFHLGGNSTMTPRGNTRTTIMSRRCSWDPSQVFFEDLQPMSKAVSQAWKRTYELVVKEEQRHVGLGFVKHLMKHLRFSIAKWLEVERESDSEYEHWATLRKKLRLLFVEKARKMPIRVFRNEVQAPSLSVDLSTVVELLVKTKFEAQFGPRLDKAGAAERAPLLMPPIFAQHNSSTSSPLLEQGGSSGSAASRSPTTSPQETLDLNAFSKNLAKYVERFPNSTLVQKRLLFAESEKRKRRREKEIRFQKSVEAVNAFLCQELCQATWSARPGMAQALINYDRPASHTLPPATPRRRESEDTLRESERSERFYCWYAYTQAELVKDHKKIAQARPGGVTAVRVARTKVRAAARKKKAEGKRMTHPHDPTKEIIMVPRWKKRGLPGPPAPRGSKTTKNSRRNRNKKKSAGSRTTFVDGLPHPNDSLFAQTKCWLIPKKHGQSPLGPDIPAYLNSHFPDRSDKEGIPWILTPDIRQLKDQATQKGTSLLEAAKQDGSLLPEGLRVLDDKGNEVRGPAGGFVSDDKAGRTAGAPGGAAAALESKMNAGSAPPDRLARARAFAAGLTSPSSSHAQRLAQQMAPSEPRAEANLIVSSSRRRGQSGAAANSNNAIMLSLNQARLDASPTATPKSMPRPRPSNRSINHSAPEHHEQVSHNYIAPGAGRSALRDNTSEAGILLRRSAPGGAAGRSALRDNTEAGILRRWSSSFGNSRRSVSFNANLEEVSSSNPVSPLPAAQTVVGGGDRTHASSTLWAAETSSRGGTTTGHDVLGGFEMQDMTSPPSGTRSSSRTSPRGGGLLTLPIAIRRSSSDPDFYTTRSVGGGLRSDGTLNRFLAQQHDSAPGRHARAGRNARDDHDVEIVAAQRQSRATFSISQQQARDAERVVGIVNTGSVQVVRMLNRNYRRTPGGGPAVVHQHHPVLGPALAPPSNIQQGQQFSREDQSQDHYTDPFAIRVQHGGPRTRGAFQEVNRSVGQGLNNPTSSRRTTARQDEATVNNPTTRRTTGARRDEAAVNNNNSLDVARLQDVASSSPRSSSGVSLTTLAATSDRSSCNQSVCTEKSHFGGPLDIDERGFFCSGDENKKKLHQNGTCCSSGDKNFMSPITNIRSKKSSQVKVDPTVNPPVKVYFLNRHNVLGAWSRKKQILTLFEALSKEDKSAEDSTRFYGDEVDRKLNELERQRKMSSAGQPADQPVQAEAVQPDVAGDSLTPLGSSTPNRSSKTTPDSKKKMNMNARSRGGRGSITLPGSSTTLEKINDLAESTKIPVEMLQKLAVTFEHMQPSSSASTGMKMVEQQEEDHSADDSQQGGLYQRFKNMKIFSYFTRSAHREDREEQSSFDLYTNAVDYYHRDAFFFPLLAAFASLVVVTMVLPSVVIAWLERS